MTSQPTDNVNYVGNFDLPTEIATIHLYHLHDDSSLSILFAISEKVCLLSLHIEINKEISDSHIHFCQSV